MWLLVVILWLVVCRGCEYVSGFNIFESDENINLGIVGARFGVVRATDSVLKCKHENIALLRIM